MADALQQTDFVQDTRDTNVTRYGGSYAPGVPVLATSAQLLAQPAPNVLTDWATIVQLAIHNASAPRSAGTSQVLHTMVVLAMYDATMAIEGGYRPYATEIEAPAGADVRAAVATAGYVTARARVAASQIPYLDHEYAEYMANIPDGRAKDAGIAVGNQAASAILVRRADDGFTNVVLYECSATPPMPGEFEPDAGCPVPGSPQPADVKLGQIRPFTYQNVAAFRPDGPDPLTSIAYAADFAETRDYGGRDSSLRSTAQTDLAYFWSENPYVHWNRNITNLAISEGLGVRDTARFLALVHTSAADAAIAGFEAKYFYAAWRPRTAIPLADIDGNPNTGADPSWRPLLLVNHPEYPSGHGFWSTAVIDAVATFFRTNRVKWTIVTSRSAVPQLLQAERTYEHLTALLRDIGDARVWAGLHWRHSVVHGMQIGRRVAAHVSRNFFQQAR